MLEVFDWKTVVAVVATIIGIVSFLPYLIGMLKGQTKPHAYTWLIWSITQGTAAVALWYGSGGIVAIGVMITAALVFVIFLLSLRYGTSNITIGDTLILFAALAAVVVWWQLNQPVLAVLMVSAIDTLGYVPTYRKSWNAPWSENLPAWILGFLYPLCALVALEEYNLLTTTYLTTIMVANIILINLLVIRRRTVARPV